MQSGSGRVVVAADGSAVLVVDDLAAAPAGKTYQAWVVEGQTQISGGTFDTSDDRAIVPLAEPVPDGAVVGVTVENAGGASSPTLPMVAASAPV
jgi:anti-sigma-K factor RskA